MAQNITSVLSKQNILAGDVQGADVLYLIHGLGSDRDRFIKIEELKKVVSNLDDVTFESISMQKPVTGGAAEVDFDGETLSMSATPAEVTDSGALEMTRLGLNYTKSPQSGGQNSAGVSAGGFTVSFVNGNGVETKTEVKYDGISTPALSAKEIAGKVPVSANEKKLVIDSALEVGKENSTNGNNLVVNGATQLKGNVVIGSDTAGSETVEVKRTAYFRSGLHARTISPIVDEQNTPKSIEIGFAPTTGTDLGGVVVKGLHKTENGVASAVQEVEFYGGVTGEVPAVDVRGGSIIYLKLQNDQQEFDLTTKLAGAVVGQRFTVISETGWDGSTPGILYVGVGESGKRWKMSGPTGCDFVCVNNNPYLFRPVGCGEWSSR